ncbi:MAG: hypothetical protein Q7K57_29335 [Burkholderiaceae bacterium]|nr:hypothetical protein [Burkholderiaceae bacterium]
MALRAGGSAPNITAFVLRESVALVSGQCGVPQWPGITKLSRGVGQQRGHVSPPVAPLGGNDTSPLDPVRCSVVSVGEQGGVPPCPGSTRLSRGVRGSCGAGRIKLLQHQTGAAYAILKDAAYGPSGNLMGLELGWLYLQRRELPMALSNLSDEVTRNPLNIEAHCLLLECYWTVG